MKTTRWIRICVTTVAMGIAALAVTGCNDSEHSDHAVQNSSSAVQTNDGAAKKSDRSVQYTCPMHPEVVQDKPGNCPTCGMKLVEKH